MLTKKPGLQLPDPRGHFGPYGGRFVPETLIPALDELAAAYAAIRQDDDFHLGATQPQLSQGNRHCFFLSFCAYLYAFHVEPFFVERLHRPC